MLLVRYTNYYSRLHSTVPLDVHFSQSASGLLPRYTRPGFGDQREVWRRWRRLGKIVKLEFDYVSRRRRLCMSSVKGQSKLKYIAQTPIHNVKRFEINQEITTELYIHYNRHARSATISSSFENIPRTSAQRSSAS